MLAIKCNVYLLARVKMRNLIEGLQDLDSFLVIEGKIAAVAVDNLSGDIYWSDHDKHTINCLAFNSSTPKVIVNAGEFLNAIIIVSLGQYTYGLSRVCSRI